MFEKAYIEKLVHGGQGLGTLSDGRKAFVWNALPDEEVNVQIGRKKKDFVEGVAIEILVASENRIKPKEDIYLATSPWQIINFSAENEYKKQILAEAFQREGLTVKDIPMITDGRDFGYRNKLEFSFYGDDDGLHYAFYNRGSHQKQIVNGSALALPAINLAAKALLRELNELHIRAADLKSVILRCTQDGQVVGALFVKPHVFLPPKLPKELKGLRIYHSNPKSPASVPTKLLQQIGECGLYDKLLGSSLAYDVTGFFQVNLPVFELALKRIDYFTGGAKNKIDMYGGVGSIGVPIGGTTAIVELDPANVAMARANIGHLPIEVIQASSEQSLDYITAMSCLIVDPPRSGLHKDVIDRILEVRPGQICYLSCNPSTQARDIALLGGSYKIVVLEGYNFFPRTPHIESLVILERI